VGVIGLFREVIFIHIAFSYLHVHFYEKGMRKEKKRKEKKKQINTCLFTKHTL
jgi:hypothetical protein